MYAEAITTLDAISGVLALIAVMRVARKLDALAAHVGVRISDDATVLPVGNPRPEVH